jgi:hypothetical protein
MKKQFTIRVDIDTENEMGSRTTTVPGEEEYYDIKIRKEHTTDAVPAISLAHELGHVISMAMDSPVFKTWLKSHQTQRFSFNGPTADEINKLYVVEEEAWDYAKEAMFSKQKVDALKTYQNGLEEAKANEERWATI